MVLIRNMNANTGTSKPRKEFTPKVENGNPKNRKYSGKGQTKMSEITLKEIQNIKRELRGEKTID